MSTDITIAAVGDFLMKHRIIASAKVPGERRYRLFDDIFDQVAPYLRNADFTIGNLETTFSGTHIVSKEKPKTPTDIYTLDRRNPKTNFPLLNCPDEFAGTLKKLGFDVLTTANNHCMDCGISGLKRTLKILDSEGLAHTGTYRSHSESTKYLIKNVKGIKIGVLAYTKGTNRIPVPSNHSWAVNLIQPKKIIADIRRLKGKTDLIIVCMHFGREYSSLPNEEQKSLVQLLFKHGADIILGAHSHVIQPAIFYRPKNSAEASKKKFAIYSLGNFISTRLYGKDLTLTGLIARLHVRKHVDGTTEIRNVEFIPTWVRKTKSGGRTAYRLVPLGSALRKQSSSSGIDPISNQHFGNRELERMKKVYQHVKRHITRNSNAEACKVL